MGETKSESFQPFAITRPDPSLLIYYVVLALVQTVFILPVTVFVLLPNVFKYRTLRYTFDDSGIRMAWGLLFKREINLTYRRIQDIHVTRNLIQRWFGLATVAVQTASGSAKPEMSIEGILEADELRDYLYSQMRGARAEDGRPDGRSTGDEALLLLTEIRDELAALRRQRNELGPSCDGSP